MRLKLAAGGRIDEIDTGSTIESEINGRGRRHGESKNDLYVPRVPWRLGVTRTRARAILSSV